MLFSQHSGASRISSRGGAKSTFSVPLLPFPSLPPPFSVSILYIACKIYYANVVHRGTFGNEYVSIFVSAEGVPAWLLKCATEHSQQRMSAAVRLASFIDREKQKKQFERR